MKVMRMMLASGVLVAWMASSALGQPPDGVMDDRSVMLEIVEPRPMTPAVNTMLAFTNTWAREVKVRLEAFDHTGAPAGNAELSIPPRGLKYFFISRILGDPDPRFVGWVVAQTSHPVSASAVLVGIGTTDLPVERHRRPRRSHVDAVRRYGILFPLTAAF